MRDRTSDASSGVLHVAVLPLGVEQRLANLGPAVTTIRIRDHGQVLADLEGRGIATGRVERRVQDLDLVPEALETAREQHPVGVPARPPEGRVRVAAKIIVMKTQDSVRISANVTGDFGNVTDPRLGAGLRG